VSDTPAQHAEKVREQLLEAILGRCESVWKDLQCRRYDGHHGYHSSGQVVEDGQVAWASWEGLVSAETQRQSDGGGADD